jgi:mono/diheme cytochrome c family protein
MRRWGVAVLALGLALMAVQCAAPDASAEAEGTGAERGPSGVDMANASRQYLMKCAMCHGENGEPVLITATDLRTSAMSVEERVAIIAYGKGTMPPHKDMLDMPAIRGIAVYIEKFRK